MNGYLPTTRFLLLLLLRFRLLRRHCSTDDRHRRRFNVVVLLGGNVDGRRRGGGGGGGWADVDRLGPLFQILALSYAEASSLPTNTGCIARRKSIVFVGHGKSALVEDEKDERGEIEAMNRASAISISRGQGLPNRKIDAHSKKIKTHHPHQPHSCHHAPPTEYHALSDDPNLSFVEQLPISLLEPARRVRTT